MRITNNMSVTGTISNIQISTEKLDKLNKQLSSGKKISIPSDDPTGTIKAMGYRSNLEEINQYIRNVDGARATLDSTDVALNQVTNILQRIRELGVEAANDTFETDARDAMGDEITQLLDQVVELANTKVGNKYIFGGFETTEPPFKSYTGGNDGPIGGPGADLIRSDGSVRTDINKKNITKVNYIGDAGKIMTEIDENVRTSFNVSGQETFLDGQNIFETIINLRDSIYREEVTDENGDGQSIQNSLDEMDDSINQTLKYRSEAGAKLHRVEQSRSKLENKKISITDLLANAEDTDVTKTIMDLKVQESVQRMALSVGARVIQPTLVDFLR